MHPSYVSEFFQLHEIEINLMAFSFAPIPLSTIPSNPLFHYSSSAVVAIAYHGEVGYSITPGVSEAN